MSKILMESSYMSEQQMEMASFFEGAEFNKETYSAWADAIYASMKSHHQFESLLEEQRAKADKGGGDALRVAIGLVLIGRFADSIDYFGSATDNKFRRYYAALAEVELGRYEQAVADFERAASRGWDPFEADMQAAAAHVRSGDVSAAQKLLARHANAGKDRSEWHYVDGWIHERQGEHVEAIEAYERGLVLNPDDPQTMFRCAYMYDLHGDDELAIDLYKRLAMQPAAHVNALINLSVLYEDMGRYHDAITCLQRVLATYPNHVRARLFLRDVESSRGMMIDEDIQKSTDGQSRLLDTQITDFELSVRSRNCLKKMNINTLGDLLRISEAELLAYKNFGETSLNEIKALLTAKGLRLGQALEEVESPVPVVAPIAPPPPPPVILNVPPGAEGALGRPVGELELSVRARKCLQRLNINTVGELISRSEADLLAIRNFGVTSLSEIKARLADMGLQLAASA